MTFKFGDRVKDKLYGWVGTIVLNTLFNDAVAIKTDHDTIILRRVVDVELVDETPDVKDFHDAEVRIETLLKANIHYQDFLDRYSHVSAEKFDSQYGTNDYKKKLVQYITKNNEEIQRLLSIN